MIHVSATGSAFARGRSQQGAASANVVRQATVMRVERARADGLIDAAALAYLAEQRAFHASNDPDGMSELLGVAEAFGLPEPDVFAHLHLGTLRDMKGGAALIDGCSAWAVGDGPEGPLVAKNRDVSGLHLGVQCIMRHSGPDIFTGETLSVGSLGGLSAWSSGINARGLAVADTQVAVSQHRVGWLRYFLMPRLLASASTVAQALTMIRSLPHAGGGALVLADASGATAAVELSARGPVIAEGGPQWRTNHYTAPEVIGEALCPDGDSIAGNSQARFDFLSRTLPGTPWTVPAAKALMATHDDRAAAAPICQHASPADGAETVSSVVYSCRLGKMVISDGAPCVGQWQSLEVGRQAEGAGKAKWRTTEMN